MTKTKITSNSRRRSGNVGLMIPMYVFTILFVALPILYLFLLSFLQRAQVWGVDFTFTLDNYIGTAVSGYFLAVSEAGIYRHLFRGADRISVRLFHGKNERCLEAQDAVAHYDPFLDQCADPPVRLDYCLSQQWCTG